MSETGEVSKSVPAFGQLINIEKKPAPETVANFQNYIYKGGMFIKEHRYEEATEHFMNEEELVKVGRGFGEAREIFIDKIPRPDEYDKLANLVAKNSWNKDGGWIELSKINYYTVTGPDGLPQRRKQILPERLQHDIALIYMEEWLHSLQDLRGRSLTGQTDIEIDVAVYMERNNIPMTEAFKRRYKRILFLKR